jgi:hypothetical protein
MNLDLVFDGHSQDGTSDNPKFFSLQSDTDQMMNTADLDGQQTRYSCADGGIVTQRWTVMSGSAFSGNEIQLESYIGYTVVGPMADNLHDRMFDVFDSYIIEAKKEGGSVRFAALSPRACCHTSSWQVPNIWIAATECDLLFSALRDGIGNTPRKQRK